MADNTEALPPLPETFTINEAEEAFVRDFCPYKGSPDPLIVWRAAWASCSAALAQRQQVPELWLVVRESVLDVGQGDDARTGGRPELGYALIANAATFTSEGEARAAIRAAGLPIGWVYMPLSRLLPDLHERINGAPALSAAPSAQAEPSDDWQHLKQYGYAPGGYMSKCHRCGATPIMDKLAVTCRPCAETMHNEAKGL